MYGCLTDVHDTDFLCNAASRACMDHVHTGKRARAQPGEIITATCGKLPGGGDTGICRDLGH
jgi:hypothetical protein